MTTDVRADGQTNTELAAQLTIESTTESIAQLIQKPIMRVCINDLERPKQLDVSVTRWGHTATMSKEQETVVSVPNRFILVLSRKALVWQEDLHIQLTSKDTNS